MFRSMAAQWKFSLVVLVLCFLLLSASAARISVRSQIDAGAGNSSQIEQPLVKDAKYVCMQKWKNSQMLSSQGKFLDDFCLANLQKARSVASNMKLAKELSSCQSSRDTHTIKLCALKGEWPEGRVSYQTKVQVPVSCFRMSTLQVPYAVVEAAVDDAGCDAMMTLSEDKQAALGKATTTTTTTTTVTTTTTSEVKPRVIEDSLTTQMECNCREGFLGEVQGEECVCTPAPCNLVGTIGSGPDCKCRTGLRGEISWNGSMPSGECIVELKYLFKEGREKCWKYKNMKLKCCTSSTGKPTKLQNTYAVELPSMGSSGRWNKTGCGYMFGDTYHNGMSGHNGACPVSIAEVMKVTSESIDVILGFLIPEARASRFGSG